MTSISPFNALVKADVITVQLVEDVAAKIPKKLGISADVILRDLKEILETKAFGDNTPKVDEQVQARISKLAPAETPRKINTVAGELEAALTKPPLPGPIWAQAHQVAAAVRGACVAMEGQISATTSEQKADKETLIAVFKEKIPGASALGVFAGSWAALAKPTGKGDFTLDHEAAATIIDAMQQGGITPALDELLEAAKAAKSGDADRGPAPSRGSPMPSPFGGGFPGGPAGPSSAAAGGANPLEALIRKQMPDLPAGAKIVQGPDGKIQIQITPEAAAEMQAQYKEQLKRPIGGKDTAALETVYKEVTAKAGTQRLVYRPESFRTELYQKIMNMVNRNPNTQVLIPILSNYITQINKQARIQQRNAFPAGEINDENVSKVTDKQLIAARQAAIEVAQVLGAANPSLTRQPSGVLNAWVSGIDLDNPHITYYSQLQDIVWDTPKGDWIKFYVNANNEECAPDAPGAIEISGKDLVKTVFAHEMNHINEKAVLNQFLMSIMLGVNFADVAKKGHLDGCLCSGCASTDEKISAFDTLMTDPSLQQFMASPKFKAAQTAFIKELETLDDFAGLESVVADARAARKALNEDAGRPTSMSAEQKAEAQAALDALDGFFLMLTQEGESTADYGAIRVMGEKAPQWMAMTFDIVSRNPGGGSSEDKLIRFKESYFRDHKESSQYDLEQAQKGGEVSHAQFQMGTTHPTKMLRAIANFDYVDNEGAKAVWRFEKRDVRERLLGAAQAWDFEIERREDKHDDFQHGTMDRPPPRETLRTLERANSRTDNRYAYDQMRVVTSKIAELIFDDGFGKGKDLPYFRLVQQFMTTGGVSIFQHKNDGNPLAALLGGGGPKQTPSCVKMAGQIAEELQKIVDSKNMPDAEHAKWDEVIDTYKGIADQGSEAAMQSRMARAQQAKMMSQFGKRQPSLF